MYSTLKTVRRPFKDVASILKSRVCHGTYSGSGTFGNYASQQNTIHGFCSKGSTKDGQDLSFAVERRFSTYDPPVNPKILSSEVGTPETILVKTSSGATNSYPNVWLRDNCQCPECFNHSAMARSFLMENLNLSPTVKEITVTKYGDLSIIWDDGHQSTYLADWLADREFTDQAQEKYRNKYKLSKRIWGSSHEVAKFEYLSLMNDDRALLDWLLVLETEGVTLVRGTPAELEATYNLCERSARVQYTHYGNYSHIDNKPNANNLAFTNKTLHTDMPTYQDTPGIIFLHMMKTHPGRGGETLLSDGIGVAEVMRRQHPELFEILTTTDVYFWDKGDTEKNVKIEAFDKITRGPTIKLDTQGNVVKVQFNNQVRDSHLDVPVDKVPQLYRAMKMYFNLLYEHSIQFKMQDGDMTVLDNMRCLHGRTMYQDGDSHRSLVTTYMSWDEATDRRRRLQQQFEE